MTDIEKLAAFERLAAALRKRPAFDDKPQDVWRFTYGLNITDKQALGLIEGTHVVVPVEPTEGMIMAAACTENDFESLRAEWGAMIKAAQDDGDL